MGVVIAHIELGELKESKVVEATLEEAVRMVLTEVLTLWNPRESDLVVTKEKVSEIKPELAEYRDIDVYIISYEIEWRGEEVIDKKFFVVLEELGEVSVEVIKELANLSRSALTELEKEFKTL